jgi:hypothetical protein
MKKNIYIMKKKINISKIDMNIKNLYNYNLLILY